RKLAHSLPDTSKAGQDRFVAVVQRGVALLAKPLDAFSVRQYLLGGRKLLVFASLRRRFIDLAKLKRDQFEPGRLLAFIHARSFELVAQRADLLPRSRNRHR